MQEVHESEVQKSGLAGTRSKQVPLIMEAMRDVAGKKSGQARRGRTMVSDRSNPLSAAEDEE